MDLGVYLRRDCDLIFDAERRWALLEFCCYGFCSIVIWSLMPKGVEHAASPRYSYPDRCDLIFDAERRWALQKFFVARILAVWFDLWCRKALSTRDRVKESLEKRVIWSLMPKGVEHLVMLLITIVNYLWFDLWCRKALSTSNWVRLPLGWKNCDLIFDAERRWAHLTNAQDGITEIVWFDLWCRKALSTIFLVRRPSVSWVIWSLMPKGVEHLNILNSTGYRKSDLIFDAERRWALYSQRLVPNIWTSVIWSLMPKGVEHIKIPFWGA